MRPTVPRVKPNFRQMLIDHPGWYSDRHGMGVFHSEEMLKDSKRFLLWQKAEWCDVHDRKYILVNRGEGQWIYYGNGKEPDELLGRPKIDPLDFMAWMGQFRPEQIASFE